MRLTPEIEARARATLCSDCPNIDHIQDRQLLGEIDALRVENNELGKVYRSNCPECGYTGCTRGKKACDTEIDALRAENSEWKELHAKCCSMVIPGETDSADAYRRMYFDMQEEVLAEHQAAVDMFGRVEDVKAQLAIAIEALEKITDPRKRDHKEPDLYTTMGCVMFIAAKAISDIGTL